MIGKTIYRGIYAFVVVAETTWRGGGYLLQLLQLPEGMTYKEFKALSKMKSGVYSKKDVETHFSLNPPGTERAVALTNTGELALNLVYPNRLGVALTSTENVQILQSNAPVKLDLTAAKSGDIALKEDWETRDYRLSGHIYKRIAGNFAIMIMLGSDRETFFLFDSSDNSIYYETPMAAAVAANEILESNFPGKKYQVRGYGIEPHEKHAANQVGNTDQAG